ncbi:hypothetical protein OF820_07195 [Oceanotoga sp. DSM 15011]|uniref:Uncharacterized protein n=1 Tax=Oceanotoga teriensis TaxID=515440 RepID=A0AA45HI64_9BACT|nr:MULTISPECIES: hypothetical protein [Oceanotoga]MDN5341705.1 hypothetical protein [Oceanotoga sp.]MDO7976349.1 hypothetical protein [Oceanotoga teriensis]PWJ89284.1 hypothetical protein C7380_11510 [Oceanotoga teriensis]UYO98859.1 hypothetical protein OF820_07195 [Oceanotoga sp. DSM 15011]
MELKNFIIPFIVVILITISGNMRYPNVNKAVINPDIKINTPKNLKIYGNNFKIEFDENKTDIEYNSKLKTNFENDTLSIYADENYISDEIKIIIGTKEKFKDVEINTLKLKISGEISADNIKISTNELISNSNFNSKNLDISGTGISLKGDFNSNNININGVGLDIDVNIYDNKIFIIDSVGINGIIRFKDDISSKMTITGIGGSIDLYTNLGKTLNLYSSKNIFINKKFF